MQVLKAFAVKLKKIYNDSFFAVLCRKISKAYTSSVIVSLNTAGTLDNALSDSVFLKHCEKNGQPYGGCILSWLFNNANRLLHISFGQAALLTAFWSLAISLSLFFEHNLIYGAMLLLPTLILFSLTGVTASLFQVICGSVAGRFFEWKSTAPAQRQNPIVLCIIGISGIIPALWLPLKWAVLIPLVTVGLLLLPALKPIFFISVLLLWLPLGGTSDCIILCVLMILSCGFQRLFRQTPKQKADYIDILLALFAVLCILGSVFSFAVSDSLRVSAMWLPLFASVFIVYRNVRNSHDLTVVLSSLLIGSFFACCIGLWQYFSGQVDTTWTDTNLFENLDIRIYSTFANPNVFGEFLLLVIPLAVGLGLYFTKWKYKISCFIAAVFSFAALALTYSRGCYVGIAITALIFLWVYSKKIFGALLVIGLPVGIAVMPQNIIDRIVSIGNLADSSTSYRLKIYEGTLNLLKTYWPSGLGIGETAFNYVYPFFGVQGIVAPHTHSLFFQLLISFGIAGFIYFLILLFVYHRNILSLAKAKDKNSKERVLLIMFGTLFFGFLVQSIFDYTWYNYRVYAIFWVIFALGLATYKFLGKREA